MQGLLRGVGDDRVLAVDLFLGQQLHHLPHARIAAHGDAAKALALTVGSVFVELDLDKVPDAEVLDVVLDVLIRCPPRQVADVELEAFVATDARRSAAAGGIDACGAGRGVILLRRERVLLGRVLGAGRQDVVVEIVVFCREIVVLKLGLYVGVEVDIHPVSHV